MTPYVRRNYIADEEAYKRYRQNRAGAKQVGASWARSQTKPGSISDVLRRYALEKITAKDADAEAKKIIESGGC